MAEQNTAEEFRSVIAECRKVFQAKLGDYGPSWRLLRPSSLTDQLLIKARRIRQIGLSGENRVGDDVRSEFIGIINYGFIGLIQLRRGFSDTIDMTLQEALALYDKYAAEALKLMTLKNADYHEAWRWMRVSSYTDFILTKIERIKEIEDHQGQTKVSEGIDANYLDIVNYAVFGAIKLKA